MMIDRTFVGGVLVLVDFSELDTASGFQTANDVDMLHMCERRLRPTRQYECLMHLTSLFAMQFDHGIS